MRVAHTFTPGAACDVVRLYYTLKVHRINLQLSVQVQTEQTADSQPRLLAEITLSLQLLASLSCDFAQTFMSPRG